MPLIDIEIARRTPLRRIADLARERLGIAEEHLVPHGHCEAKLALDHIATLRGAPVGHTMNVRQLRLAAGAGFVVMVCGDAMTMPALPEWPAAEQFDLDDDEMPSACAEQPH